MQPDGTLRIHETIAYDFGVVPHHGIFRDLVERESYDARRTTAGTASATCSVTADRVDAERP